MVRNPVRHPRGVAAEHDHLEVAARRQRRQQ
jgi:hypothetical protein